MGDKSARQCPVIKERPINSRDAPRWGLRMLPVKKESLALTSYPKLASLIRSKTKPSSESLGVCLLLPKLDPMSPLQACSMKVTINSGTSAHEKDSPVRLRSRLAADNQCYQTMSKHT